MPQPAFAPLALVGLLSLASPAAGQDAEPFAPPTSPAQPDAPPPAEGAMHPGVLLGRRAGLALAGRGVIPAVVIVSDPADFAHAVSGWTPEAIFPVLIDDGSAQSREDIARFVRGFRPDSVVRWRADREAARAGAPMRARRAVPNARSLTDAALGRAWGVQTDDAGETADAERSGALISQWIARRHAPPGVVIADERDPAWTAALTLAAARGQPIMWAELPNLSVDAALSSAEIAALSAEIEAACVRTGLPWRELGDAVDAVTICAGLPARYETMPEEFGATTDRLGRFADGSRWAWAGQVFGSEPQAAYRAMCSVFLGVRNVWLFDGYGSTEPWVQWDGTQASGVFEQAGLLAMTDDEPHNRLTDWRLRCERPVRADLICVNSSGNRGWFDLAGSRAWAGDIPLLETPAAVHMVHSWSAVGPGRPATVAGRWFDRGVFAYIGSVHEPYLQAFVPTPVFARRVLAGMAFGAAGRVDGGAPWRVAVLGDPLFAFGPRPERRSAAMPLGGAEPLDDLLRAAGAERRYAEMYGLMNQLGRDSDIARLFQAMLRDHPQALDAATAEAALSALFRTGSDDAFLRAYAVLPEQRANEPEAVDALWYIGRRAARERGDYREAALTLMAAHARERQADADAAELQQLLRRR